MALRNDGDSTKHYARSSASENTLENAAGLRKSFEELTPQGGEKLGNGAVGFVYTDPEFPGLCIKVIHDQRELDMQIRMGIGTTLREEFFLLKDAYASTKDMPVRAVKPVDFIERDGDEALFAMEHVHGKTLRLTSEDPSLLTHPERLLSIDFEAIEQQFINAFTAIHTAGLLHKDIGPHNLMVDENLNFFIIDFGRAKRPAEKGLSEEEIRNQSSLEIIDLKLALNEFKTKVFQKLQYRS